MIVIPSVEAVILVLSYFLGLYVSKLSLVFEVSIIAKPPSPIDRTSHQQNLGGVFSEARALLLLP